MKEKKIIKTLPLSLIRRDGGTQLRIKTDEAVVAEYAEQMRNGDAFPSPVVFDDGGTIWLADGFHRIAAAELAGSFEFACEVRLGTQRDAKLHAATANGHHGLRRSNDDKRNVVKMFLIDEEWSKWSDREIARHAGVDHKTVARARSELSGEIPQMRNVQRNGTTYSIDTTNIGQPGEEDFFTDADSEEVETPNTIIVKPAKPAPALPKDKFGTPIPANLKDAFATALTLDQLAAATRAVRGHIAKLVPSKMEQAGPGLAALATGRARLREWLKSTEKMIADARPSFVCLRCKGEGCASCHDLGYIVAAHAEVHLNNAVADKLITPDAAEAARKVA